MNNQHPWVRCNDATGSDPYMLECERCGGKQRFEPPLSVDYFVGVVKAFVREHENCREPIRTGISNEDTANEV